MLQSLAQTLPLLDQFVANRSVYSRMGSGLLGPVRDNLVNRGVASHVQDGLDEMTEALDALDNIIRQAEQPVFNDMRQSLQALGTQIADIRTAARITSRT